MDCRRSRAVSFLSCDLHKTKHETQVLRLSTLFHILLPHESLSFVHKYGSVLLGCKGVGVRCVNLDYNKTMSRKEGERRKREGEVGCPRNLGDKGARYVVLVLTLH